MPDTNRSHNATPPSGGGRVPNEAQAAALHSRVQGVLDVLDVARAHAERVHAERAPSVALPPLVQLYSARLEAAMLALGEVIAAFFEASPEPADLEALRSTFLEPILSLSRSLPAFNRAEEWRRNKEKTVELHELVLAGRVVGFDAETRLLDNFYQNSVYPSATRSRISGIVRVSTSEMERRSGVNPDDMRVLVIGANSVPPVSFPFVGETLIGRGSALIVDGDVQALRLARQRYEDAFGLKPDVLRVKPESLATSRHAIGAPFHVVYTLMQYDMMSPQAGLAFTRALSEMMRPGAVLVTGCFLPSISQSYRALALALMDIQWQYWDEAMWREMLGQLPFDLSASYFQSLEPATLIVIARRSGSKGAR